MARKDSEHFMKLQRAGEDYLKAVFLLQRKNGKVRSLDVAEYLNVTKPSVSVAIRQLREGGFLTMDAGKLLHLTDAGREAAERIGRRSRPCRSVTEGEARSIPATGETTKEHPLQGVLFCGPAGPRREPEVRTRGSVCLGIIGAKRIIIPPKNLKIHRKK